MSIKKKKKKREKKRGADRRISRYTDECGLHHTSRSPYVAWVACLHEWPFGASVITCSRNNERLILSSYHHSRLLSSSVATYRPFVLCCPFNRSWHTVLWFALPHTLYTMYFFFSLSLSLSLSIAPLLLLPPSLPPSLSLSFFFFSFFLLFLFIISSAHCWSPKQHFVVARGEEQSINSSPRVAFALHPAPSLPSSPSPGWR